MTKYTPFSLYIRQCLLYPLESPFLPPEDKVEKDFSYANGALVGTLVGGDGAHYPADQQFVDNEDGTVSDLSTGLMWVQDFEGAGCNYGVALSQADAVSFCNNLVFAGYSDWRLPHIRELNTIIDYSNPNIAMFTDYFFNFSLEDYGFWSITETAFSPGYFYFQDISGGNINFDSGEYEFFILPVRTI